MRETNRPSSLKILSAFITKNDIVITVLDVFSNLVMIRSKLIPLARSQSFCNYGTLSLCGLDDQSLDKVINPNSNKILEKLTL